MMEKTNYIILGNPERAEEIKRHLMEKYGIGESEVKTVFAEEISIKNIIEEADVIPLFSKRKIIYIKDCEKISTDDCKKLKKFFESPSPDVFLILSGKNIKSVLKDFVDEVHTEEKKVGLYPAIYRMRSPKDKKKLIFLLKEYIKNNPYDFPAVINAASIYLRNIIINQKRIDKKILDRYNKLQRLDFDLKTGRINKENLDIFLFHILDI